MKRKKKIVTSGDAVVDWVFGRICDILNHEDIQAVVTRIKHKKKTGFLHYLGGCEYNFNGYCVHVSKTLNKEDKYKTFFHEILHIFCEHAKEASIEEGENLLWPRMSEEQKQIIAWYFKERRKK
jgi:hypothetical protein